LLTPFELAGKRLRNRVMHASMTKRIGKNTRVTAQQIRYYENRAKGGAAISSIYDYQHAQAVRAGVRFELGVDATRDDLESSHADALNIDKVSPSPRTLVQSIKLSPNS